jgi:hypothetical protein
MQEAVAGFFGHGRTLSVSKEPVRNVSLKDSHLNMTINPIRAVVFDMGGTLEELYYDDTSRMQATVGLHELLTELDLDPGMRLSDLHATVLAGMKAYQEWREANERELPPESVDGVHFSEPWPAQGTAHDGC